MDVTFFFFVCSAAPPQNEQTKKTQTAPCKLNIWAFLYLFTAWKCLLGDAHIHARQLTAQVANVVLHLAEGTKEARKAQTLLLKPPRVSLDAGFGSVCRCRCHPARNPAALRL